ncbi:MAG: BACON domain-containing protein, partial [Methanomicrobiales archaeon]
MTASSSSCSWTATPAADWITIKSGSTGTGNGTVTYSVAANTEIVPRTGAIAVDTLTFTVTEAEKSILSATTQNFPVEGGTGSFNVVAPSSAPSLQWTAESDNWWITIINGNAGMGNGTVTFMVASNPETASRTGTITVSGQTFTVTQDALTISLELKAGWNFISFRLQPNDRSIENILAPVLSKVRIVWGYDNKLKKWLHYKPGAAGNLLLEMESQKGYWIYMKEAGTIVLAGSSMLPDVELDPGWNLVGYSGTDGAGTAAGVHDYLTDGWITFWTWDKGEWLAAFNGATNLQVKALETLHHNKAYWLKIQSEAYGLIGSAGGTVAGPRASVVVPGGAWAQSAPIQITPVSGSPLGEESHASGVFQITGIPDVFEQPLTIKIKLDRPVVGKALMMVGRDVVNLETGSVFRRYEYLAATEADGYMTAQIPPPATAATPLGISPLKEPLYSDFQLEKGNQYVAVVDNFVEINCPTPYPAGSFRVIQRKSLTTACDVCSYLNESLKAFIVMGFTNARRTTWPMEVQVLDMSDEGGFIPSIWGEQYGRLTFKDDVFKDNMCENLKASVAHEMFHFFQDLYDPRGPYAKASSDPSSWINEATASWTEEILKTDPGSHVPDNFSKNLVQAIVFPPQDPSQYWTSGDTKLTTGQMTDWGKHGYGLAGLIKYFHKHYYAGNTAKFNTFLTS